MADTRKQVIDQLQELGWSKEQSIGIAANLHQESTFNPAAVGDGGKAYGIAQWHPDRQAGFKAAFGKDIKGSTLEEQVRFVDYELRKGSEQAAGRRLLAATDAGTAASIVSQYYERPADRVGEANRRGRTAAAWAGGQWQDQEVPAVAPKRPQEASDWPMLPQARAYAKDGAQADLGALLGTSIAGFKAEQGTAQPAIDAMQREEARLTAEQAQRDATGFTDVFQASRRDPRDQAMFTLLDYVNRDPNQDAGVDPGWYLANKDRIESGRNDEERAYLRENVKGPDSLTQAEAQLQYRRELDKGYGYASGWANFTGHMAGGMMDPVGFAAGLGVGKALQVAGIGSRALIAAGRGQAAAASLVAEGALGNVAVEGIQDALGETKTSADYFMAAAAGVALTAPFTRGVFREANAAHLKSLTDGMSAKAVQEQVDKIVEYKARTGETDPAKIARGIMDEEAKAIQDVTKEATSPKLREAVLPEEVTRTMREDYEKPAVVDDTPPMTEKPQGISDTGGTKSAFEPEPIDLPVLDPTMLDVPGVEVRTRDNKPVRLHYDRNYTMPDGRTTFSPRNVLDGLIANKKVLNEAGVYLDGVAKYLRQALSDDVLDNVAIKWVGPKERGSMARQTNELRAPTDKPQGDLKGAIEGLTPRHVEVVLHELVHAGTQSKIDAYLGGKGRLTPEQQATMQEFDDLFTAFKAEVKKAGLDPAKLKEAETSIKAAHAAGTMTQKDMLEYKLLYATKNLHEFATMSMTSPQVRGWMRQIASPVKEGAKPSTLWRSFVDKVAALLGIANKPNMQLHASGLVDRIIGMDGSNIVYATNDMEALQAPAAFSGASQRNFAQRIYQHAANWVAKNPIDESRLKVLTALAERVGGLSDGLVLARSANPILNMVAGLVTETTTGAAGRGPTAAIRTKMLHEKIVGDSLLGYSNSWTTWSKANGATVMDTWLHGEKKREFNRLVYSEILDRRDPNYSPNGRDAAVVEAADHLEVLHERARKLQIEAGTLGSANLPGNSRGYVTQALDGAKLQTLTVQELAGLHAELSRQFQANLGWDAAFADTFAPYYTDRVRRRSQGSKEVDAVSGGGNAIDVIRDTLDDMAVDPAMRDKMTAAQQARAGVGHTKRRLDIDLRKEFVPGRTLMDVYVDDPLTLARMYARRTAGHVALAEQGVLGIRGIRELREAAATTVADNTKALPHELEAFDRVMAEIIGMPIAGQVTSAGATNLAMVVNLQRLGGLVFTQMAEMWNMLHHLGFRSTLSGIASLPQMMGEVGRLKKGGKSGNHILTSLETYGGEFGLDQYKLVAPLDPPDARVEDYMKQAGLLSRLLRAGGHAQQKVSFFRGLLSAQHRAVAEQITLKAARFINEGGNDRALADMGFTPAMVAAFKQELPHVATFDRSGRLQTLDLTQVKDPANAEAFVQAVHRGTGQIIQGTFIGERSKWMHNDYMKLLLQLRTFGLTATEKQLQRTAMNAGGGAVGYAYVAGLMLGQMALAVPIHLARVQIASAGRGDREEFLRDNLNPAAVMRAVMNYSSITGMTGDIAEILTSVAGGWMDEEGKELIGARNTQQAQSVGRLVPIAGTVDSAFKVASGKADVHTALKQLPFSNMPYLVPLLNLSKGD